MELDNGLYKIGNPLSPHDRDAIDPNIPPHVRILTYIGLTELAKYIGFKVDKIIGNGHILRKLGEKIDKRHYRFITIKVRK